MPPSPALTANLIAQIAYGLFAMTVCLPSMAEWGALFSRPQDQVQLTFSGFVLTFGVLQLAYGPLSDRLGRRAMILWGLSVCIVGSVMAAQASDLPLLVAARALQGAGAAAGMVVGRAAVQDLFHGAQRTRVMAYVGMTLGLCPPLGTVVGGQIHVALGWQFNFVLVAAMGVVLFAAAWWGLPRRRAVEPAPGASDDGVAAAGLSALGHMGRSYAQLLRRPDYLWHAAVLAFTTAAFHSFLAGAPLVLRSYGIGPGEVGFFIMTVPLAYIVGNFVTSRLVQRLGGAVLMVVGQGLSLTGTVVMLGLGLAGVHTPLAFVLPLMLLGVGHGMLVPPCIVAMVALVPALAGAASALGGVSQQFAGAIGGYLVGWVDHASHTGLAVIMLCATVFASLARTFAARSDRVSRKAA